MWLRKPAATLGNAGQPGRPLRALLELGDTVLSMSPRDCGHLSHGDADTSRTMASHRLNGPSPAPHIGATAETDAGFAPSQRLTLETWAHGRREVEASPAVCLATSDGFERVVPRVPAVEGVTYARARRYVAGRNFYDAAAVVERLKAEGGRSEYRLLWGADFRQR
jgi:hypothetical protein